MGYMRQDKISFTNSAAWGYVNNVYLKDTLSNDNIVHYLNTDSKILNIPDKIWHCKTTGSPGWGRVVSKKLTKVVMEKKIWKIVKGDFTCKHIHTPFLKKNPWLMADRPIYKEQQKAILTPV